jgi:hypothetical protein
MSIAESTHWYDVDGNPRYTIIGKNGNERATTLRDARQLNLYPSVTSIIKVAAAPGLENWKIDQALLAALTLPRLEDESLDDFMARAKRDAREQGLKAAERGTEIHAAIELGFSTGFESDAYNAVRAALEERWPGEEWIAESSFAHSLGFGGKIDLYTESGIFVDFKTKDNLDTSDPSKLVYDEHGMQLSAYAMGKAVGNPIRASVFVDRVDVTKVAVHVWDSMSHYQHSKMFTSLLEYWQAAKNYFPGAVS